jgi:hypothetical protein
MRPRRIDSASSTERLTIRLTPDERRDLETVARENGTSLAETLREAVNEYVADYRERAVFVAVSGDLR